jgi:hypothetical protein
MKIDKFKTFEGKPAPKKREHLDYHEMMEYLEIYSVK